MKKSFILSMLLIFAVLSPLSAKSKSKKVQEDDSVLQVSLTEKKVETEEQEAEVAPDMRYYSSWKKISNKKIDKTFGNMRIRVLPKRGSFNIGVVNSDGKTIPVLSNLNEYSSTYFVLKAGKKLHKLVAGGNVYTKARATEDCIQIIYSVEEVADVLLELRPVESVAGNGYDMLKFNAIITNTGKRTTDFALKVVMDTVLGEADFSHFYTSEDIPVKSEVRLRTMANAKYFNSKNSGAWAQFILSGGDISEIEEVSLANYDTLSSANWEPSVSSDRTFDTVTSYNNSAVGIIWQNQKTAPQTSKNYIFYMAFASDGERPAGLSYFEKSGTPSSVKKSPEEDKPKVETVKKTPAQVEVPDVPQPKETPEKSEEINDIEDENAIPAEILTPAYLQSILDRIEKLENSKNGINRDELKMLNDELDFILSLLRNN